MKSLPRGDSHTIKQPGQYYCWNCGRGCHEPPKNWHGPWLLEVAHIASGGGRAVRVDDARAVILACSRCHRLHLSNADKLPKMTIAGATLLTLDERHFLFVKREMDPKGFDVEFLQQFWIGKVPSPVRPPDYWCNEFTKRTGILR